jgi:uncharacterized protein (DUF362 family)
MERREFIKKSVTASFAATIALYFSNLEKLFAQANGNSNLPYDLVAVRNGEPDVMFDAGIDSLGGMKTFVKPGNKVVVKPNIGWDVVPARAANTNPLLVKRIVEQCYSAGAGEVYVFDYTCDEWANCYKNSEIEAYAKKAGAKVVPGNFESYYRPVTIKKGISLKEAKVHELILDSDVFINVPVLKHHSSADLSIAMKNMMGIVWDRRYWHRNDLHQCIADFASYRQPDLNVIDAYRVMLKNGPRGVSESDVALFKTQILTTDIVAGDAAASKLFGTEPQDVPYIVKAAALGVGTYDLASLNINRIKLS